MKSSTIEKKLFEELENIKVIDAHEHLAPEEDRTKRTIDLPVLFAWPYTAGDLASAGMPRSSVRDLADTEIALQQRWEMLSPYLSKIRYGSYARAVYLSVKGVYGFDDINDENYVAISEAMAEANVPGIYHRILREKCNIQTVLTQAYTTNYDLDLLVPLMPLIGGIPAWADVHSRKEVEEKAKELGKTVRTLDDFVRLVKERIEGWKSEGAVGVKIGTRPYPEADRGRAIALFDRMMQDPGLEVPDDWDYPNPLQSYLLDESLAACADLDLVVAVHTGMWAPGYYLQDAKLLIPILMKHPGTRFDIYHMGMPNVRETGMIGKTFANAWLNLCWSNIISPQMVVSALDEWIDLVPVNKIIAFGGDYGASNVECIYGHLFMAKENIARVLGRRVEDGLISVKEAVSLAKDWFYNVPKELYKL